MNTWAQVTSSNNGNRPRPPGGNGVTMFGNEEQHDLSRHNYHPSNRSPMRKNNLTKNYNERGTEQPYGRDHRNTRTDGFKQSSYSRGFESYTPNFQNNNHPYSAEKYTDSFFHQQEELGHNQLHTTQKLNSQSMKPHNQFVTESSSNTPKQNQPQQKENDISRFKNNDDFWSATPKVTEKTKWESERVKKKQRQQQRQTRQKSEWWYTDPQGTEQGPFQEDEMKEWFNEGFFDEQLMVRSALDQPFKPLGDYFRTRDPAFLEKLPEATTISDRSYEDTQQPTTSPHKPQSKSTTPISSNEPRSINNLNMAPLGNVIHEASKQPVQQASIPLSNDNSFIFPVMSNTDQINYSNHRGFSTLDSNATPFNPSAGYEPRPPVTNFSGMKPKIQPQLRQTTEPHLFSSPYQGYPVRPNPPTSFDTAQHSIPSVHRPPIVRGGFENGNLGMTPGPKGLFYNGMTTSESQPSSTLSRNPPLPEIVNRFQPPHAPSSHAAQTMPPQPNNSFYDTSHLLQTKPKEPVTSQVPLTSGPGIIDMLNEPKIEEETKGKEVSASNPSNGGWNEIGIPTSVTMSTTPSRTRPESPISSPFAASNTVGTNDFMSSQKKKQETWVPAGIPQGVVQQQEDVNKATVVPGIHQPEENDVQSLRRGNDSSNVQIQRQRSPNDRSNLSWLNSGQTNGNNHVQRQQHRNDGMGGKSRPTQPWGNSSWDAGRPRIAAQTNKARNSNSSSATQSPSNRNHWNGNVKEEPLIMSSNHNSMSSGSTTTSIKSNQNTRINQQRGKPLISKGDPTMSSNKTTRNTNVSTKQSKNKQSTDSNFGTKKISQEFETWCLQQIKQLQNKNLDGRSLIQFLMMLNNDNEIREYILIYCGDTPQSQAFAEGFIQNRKFELDHSDAKGFQQSKRRGRRGKRRNKQN